jgi:signal transduction histidine kinase
MLLLFIYLRLNLKGPPFIKTLRWMAVILLFALFIGINQIFLFHNSRILFYLSPAIVLLGLLMLHLLSERILLKRLAEKEKQELREKLSSDLHDDLASTLGSISIYSETLKNADRSPIKDYHALAAKISELTQSALQSITDIIWMTTPRNDSLQQLLSKTNTLMYEILTDNQIRYSSELKVPEKEIILSDKLRNDLFLILKEALHNIISHAGAKNVSLTAYLKERSCEIRLNDDGCGFSEDTQRKSNAHGNGLINMRRRAVESKIELNLDSKPGQGTRLCLVFQI